MEEMQITSKLTWIEVQFAKKAVDEVFKCRMTLKWTYAMAYYLAKGNEKELFEDNQRCVRCLFHGGILTNSDAVILSAPLKICLSCSSRPLSRRISPSCDRR